MSNIILKNKYYFAIISLIFFLDRISKLIILKISEPTGDLNIIFNSFINFNLVWNRGIGFGFFSFHDQLYYNVLTLIIIIITIVIVWLMVVSQNYDKFGYSLIAGGSLGNIFDRIFYSSVVDFIDIHINNHHWFIFNIADVFITLGIIILIYSEIKGKKVQK